MVEFLSGDHLWDQLSEMTAQAVQRRAAIAYAGRTAARIMTMVRGDVVVVDGSDRALAAGSTHPTALAQWLDAGSDVWSLPDLHAKVILLKHEKGTSTAIVGSANISDHSHDDLYEAALKTTDNRICNAVSKQLDRWVAQACRVDEDWIRRARTVYREPRRPRRSRGVRRNQVRIDPQAPLWVCMWTPTYEPLSAPAEAAFDQAVRYHGEPAPIYAFLLNKGEEYPVRPGDNVVLVNNSSDRDEPVGQAKVWAPAKVVRVVPGTKGHLPVAILVYDPDLPHHRFSRVRDAVEGSGGTIDWDCPLDHEAAVNVYRIWIP